MNLKFWKRKSKGLPLEHTMEDVRDYVEQRNLEKIKKLDMERINRKMKRERE